MCQMRQFDFINLYRQAVIAKEQGDMARSVTRIAVLLFIPRYFSTCFKQRFGLSPTDSRRAKAGE